MWLCKRDLSEECKGEYKDYTDCVLDKIRAEIQTLQTYKMFTGENTIYVERDNVLTIINKHRAESEE